MLRVTLNKQWRRWVHGVVAAVVGGGTSPMGAMVLKPDAFNLRGQVRDFLLLWAVSGLMAVFMYFKSAPPPIYSDEEAEIAPRDWKDK